MNECLNVNRLGHSLYGFARKEEYFDSFSNIMGYKLNKNDKEKELEREINIIVVKKDYIKLSKLCLFSNQFEQEYLSKHKKKIVKFLKQHSWKKGINLFKNSLSRN